MKPLAVDERDDDDDDVDDDDDDIDILFLLHHIFCNIAI
jgi:hypothetical protein